MGRGCSLVVGKINSKPRGSGFESVVGILIFITVTGRKNSLSLIIAFGEKQRNKAQYRDESIIILSLSTNLK